MAASLRVCSVIVLAMLAGCSRSHYRQRADADAYSLIHEKAGHTAWDVPYDYDVLPMPGSRFYDPTAIDDPLLPNPSPQLYAYDLPQLQPRDPERFRQRLQSGSTAGDMNPFPDVHVASTVRKLERLPDVTHQIDLVSLATPIGETSSRRTVHGHTEEYSRANIASSPDTRSDLINIQQATYSQQNDAASNFANDQQAELPTPDEVVEATTPDDDLRLTPVPRAAWEEVPQSCKLRMFEFESIREEYRRTFEQSPSDYGDESGKALALEDIVELALLNSREYQTQKETLYRTALRLSLQRFDYDLKFSTSGNRIATNYTHDRSGGITVNRLRVPSGYQVDKMLATGGTVLLRFANNLVLTFNGSNGFATDIGSDIVLDIEQTLLQIDVQFEGLTQAERDLVYAARDFARFRKTLYTSLATRYYSLIRTYRQVEIDSQNYLTLARAFDQAKAEYRNNQERLFQVDQVEQNVLRGRSRLIQTCNGLEQSLDNLKISIGLPTETLVNIDLIELEQLTQYDELAVRRELVRRVHKRLENERNSSEPELVVLYSTAVDLIGRLLTAFEIMEKLDEQPTGIDELKDLRARIGVLQVRNEAETVRERLQRETTADSPNFVAIFGRSMDLIERLCTLVDNQVEVAALQDRSQSEIIDMRTTAAGLRSQLTQLGDDYESLVARLDEQATEQEGEARDVEIKAEFQRLIDKATALLKACEEYVTLLDQVAQIQLPPQDPDQALQQTIQAVDALLDRTEETLAEIGGGLAPIEVEFDDAMMTALVLRFDLMNERGALADDWRQIKLAADDLKSVLNLRATQTVSSPGDSPFDFSFDDSNTALSATLDLPLNRRAQRNQFRQQLIDYQAALRRLMAAEDDIKLDVRNDLRDLALDQEQYRVDVASAGLAYERVVSTQLEQRLGIGGVTARDFLEAQDAYISALSSVAGRHIDYIVDRMELFLDTELLEVDELGLWNGLYDESVKPTPYYQLPSHAYPFYGELPHGLHFSKAMRRMTQVPPGTSMFHRDPTAEELQPAPEPVHLPPQ